MAAEDPALDLHQLTRHGVRMDRSALVPFRPLDPHNRPAPFKHYQDVGHVPLIGEFDPPAADAADVLSGRGVRQGGAVDAAALSRLLFLSGGVTRTARMGDHRSFFRAAMSAGNLHPLEIYVATPDLGPVDAGLYHFAPDRFVLDRLRPGDQRSRLADAIGDDVSGCGLVITGFPWRTGWKYGERGWRHLWWDAGTMLANLLAVADSAGIATRLWVGFVDDEIRDLVGVDGIRELPLVVVSFGAGSPPEQEASAEPLELAVDPISPAPITFPLVTAAHRAGDLPDATAVEGWRLSGASLGQASTTEVGPPAEARGSTIDEVILRRGSTRVMRREEVPAGALTWPLAVASRALPWDVVPDHRTLAGHHVNVHAVAHVEPGAYQLVAGSLRSLRSGDLRDMSTHLTLDQELGGDSAYTVFHTADLEAISEALGPRGYRAAQLESGIASGRLALAAFALGLGASGLTFYDDEVSQFFDTTEQPMLVTTLGVPDYRNRPGGEPGRPVELTGFDRLQERLMRKLRRF